MAMTGDRPATAFNDHDQLIRRDTPAA